MFYPSYQKFIQGKDVSRYSEKDMKAIFSFNSKPDSLKSENQADEKQVLDYYYYVAVSSYFQIVTITSLMKIGGN